MSGTDRNPARLPGAASRLLRSLVPDRYAALSVATVAAVLLLWAVVGASGRIDPLLLPPLTSLWTELRDLIVSGYNGMSLGRQVTASFARALTGFLLAIAFGIPMGILVGSSRVAEAIFQPFLGFFRPIPPIALIPLFIFYFGIGELSKIILIAITAFWYITLNTTAGVRSVPVDLVLAAQSLGLTRSQVFRKVVIPAALPHIFVGLRVGMALCWALVVAAELIAAQVGLGFMIMDATNFFRIPTVFIGIGIIGLIGLALELILNVVERRTLHWRGK